MGLSGVTFNEAITQSDRTNASGTQLNKDFTEFLTLLTTQLQYQDPLSPMDTTEFTNQLVMFSGVEQQINANQKLDNLVALMLGNSFSSSLQYVGMDISYLSNDLAFDGETPTTIKFALNDQAVEAKINIRDENGRSIYSEDIERSPGQHEFTWDGTLSGGGKAEPGTYTVTIDALDSNDKAIGSTTVVTGRVRGIETQSGIIHALVGDRAVPLNSILQANTPGMTG